MTPPQLSTLFQRLNHLLRIIPLATMLAFLATTQVHAYEFLIPDEGVVSPGGTTMVPLLLEIAPGEEDVQGLQVAIRVDVSVAAMIDMKAGPALAGFNDGAGPGFFVVETGECSDPSESFAAVVFSFTGPEEVLKTGTHHVFDLELSGIAPGTTALDMLESINCPGRKLETIVISRGVSITPDMTDGKILVADYAYRIPDQVAEGMPDSVTLPLEIVVAPGAGPIAGFQGSLGLDSSGAIITGLAMSADLQSIRGGAGPAFLNLTPDSCGDGSESTFGVVLDFTGPLALGPGTHHVLDVTVQLNGAGKTRVEPMLQASCGDPIPDLEAIVVVEGLSVTPTLFPGSVTTNRIHKSGFETARCEDAGACLVFMTSLQNLTGNLVGHAQGLGLTPSGGLDAGDRICQFLADQAGLGGDRKYMAWLSDSTGSPSTRFITRSGVPYRRVDDVLVADDWSDLTDGSIQATINVYENGAATDAGAYAPWTGTNIDGSADPGNHFCDDWSSEDVLDQGLTGRWANTNAQWTFAGTRQCNGQRSLDEPRSDSRSILCFEQ